MDKILIIGSGNIGYKFKNRNFYANYFDILKAKYKKKNIILFDKKDNKVFKKLSNSILKKLSKEKVKLLIVSTPDNTHYPVLKKIFKFFVPKKIVIEKLVSNKLMEHKRLISLEKKYKTKILVNYFRRYLPIFVKLKKKIRNNKPINIQFNFSKGFVRNGCHYIDLMFFLFNKKYRDIKKIYFHKSQNLLEISFKNLKSSITFKNLKTDYNVDEVNIYFTKQNFLIKNLEQECIYSISKKRYTNSNITFMQTNSIKKNKTVKFLEPVIENILGEKNLISNLKSSYETMLVLKKIKLIN